MNADEFQQADRGVKALLDDAKLPGSLQRMVGPGCEMLLRRNGEYRHCKCAPCEGSVFCYRHAKEATFHRFRNNPVRRPNAEAERPAL